jgi:hypothetical protein
VADCFSLQAAKPAQATTATTLSSAVLTRRITPPLTSSRTREKPTRGTLLSHENSYLPFRFRARNKFINAAQHRPLFYGSF